MLEGREIEVVDCGPIEYDEALDLQQKFFNSLTQAKTDGSMRPGKLIFCEHPHVYTIGRSGDHANMLISEETLERIGARLTEVGRGGDITYHGPGQLVGYPILDLERFDLGLKEYIERIEQAVILTLGDWGIEAGRLGGATGVWIEGKRKICAIGVKASRYITMHGFALNIATDLDYFSYINPCGFTDKGVTSMEVETGSAVSTEEVKKVLAPNLIKCLRG